VHVRCRRHGNGDAHRAALEGPRPRQRMSQPSPPALLARAYRFINRPYYLLRPQRALLRLLPRPAPPSGIGVQPRLLTTAWGSHVYCFGDSVGDAVKRTGTYELVVAEALARLAERGETGVDAGANVGLFTNVLALAVGARGRVVAFEPHPEIHKLLRRNVELWRRELCLENIDMRAEALSSQTGSGELTVWGDFADNRGTASLEPMQTGAARSVHVPTVRLDEVLAARTV